MKYKVEVVDKSETALFISPRHNNCEERFKKILFNYSYIIKRSLNISDVINKNNLIILFTSHFSDIKNIITILPEKSKLIIIFYSASNNIISACSKIHFPKSKHIKIICIRNNDLSHQETENALWFGLSESKENIITYNGFSHPKENKTNDKKNIKKTSFKLSRLHLIGLVFLFIALFHITILSLYGYSLLKIYNAYSLLRSGKISDSEGQVNSALTYSIYSKRLFSYMQPAYALFGIANTIDSFLSIPELASKTFSGIYGLEKHARFIIGYITNSPEQSEQEIQIMRFHISESLKKTDEVLNSSSLLIQKLPPWGSLLKRLRQKLLLSEEALLKIRPLLANADEMIGQSKDQKYLIFFFNNMELRPGGGFIGSYAIAVFNDYRLKELRVEDVYDADGQLKAHIEPPPAIKNYLRQPHWFLRDSNFDPDFLVNTQKAFYFLEKEMGYTEFKGSVGITTTAIQYIIDAIGQIYLPDWQETITKDNFYIKTQVHAEKDFFPGSIQKKSFLNSLMRTLIQKAPETSYQNIAIALRRSLEEKHIVLYSKNQNIQQLFEQSGWSGRRVSPTCAQSQNSCVLDFIFPYDANLGLNKSNFYVKRQYELTTTFNPEGKILHRLKTIFTNDSPTEAFPGGTYGNYFQILIPKDSEQIYVFLDGKIHTNIDIENREDAKKVGLYIEVSPQSSKTVQLEYRLGARINKGKTVYQLIAQKQIGSMNNDFNLHIYTSPKTHIVNQNFSSLAKDGYLIYNTSLSNDRIFFIEIVTE